MPAYGIDTSVFVRVLNGLPTVDYQTTVKRQEYPTQRKRGTRGAANGIRS